MKTLTFYNIYTGRINIEDSQSTRAIVPGWTPYYNLEGEYIGAKEGLWGYGKRVTENEVSCFVDSYWNLLTQNPFKKTKKNEGDFQNGIGDFNVRDICFMDAFSIYVCHGSYRNYNNSALCISSLFIL